ncbi:SatD family protein [Flavobacterium sp. LB2R40]|uniref:SatD family protein n=1 Tax=unclassified Flavobacterium TaxID=196869 RepID=UPI003AAE3F3D
MEAIITGDIIQSRKTEVEVWITALKEILGNYGTTPLDWELYRGDSFQIITTPQNVLFLSVIIKAGMKKINNIDVRMGLGIGELEYRAEKVTESNGTAFINSGTCFDSLKKQTVAIKTPWRDFDETINVMLDLATFTMDKWSEKTAEIMLLKLQSPELNQKEIATHLNKKGQGNISEGLKRGGYEEINKVLEYYQKKIKQLC